MAPSERLPTVVMRHMAVSVTPRLKTPANDLECLSILSMIDRDPVEPRQHIPQLVQSQSHPQLDSLRKGRIIGVRYGIERQHTSVICVPDIL
jgi:hypothetical protein